MRLPKPIYEVIPYFLVAVGILFVTLVVLQYEYAPTLFVFVVGWLCIFGGSFVLLVRVISRREKSSTDD